MRRARLSVRLARGNAGVRHATAAVSMVLAATFEVLGRSLVGAC